MSLAASSSANSVRRGHGATGTGSSASQRSNDRDRGCSQNSLEMSSHTMSSSHHHCDASWEAKEELRMRELEEARARATQMEKTMRWWSDCTANWREKWSKVRTERNKAREEVRVLRTKLEVATKDNLTLKREKSETDLEFSHLRKELEVLKSSEKITGALSVTSSPGSLHLAPERDIPFVRSEAEKPMIELKPQFKPGNNTNDSIASMAAELDVNFALCTSSLGSVNSDMGFFDRHLLQSKPDQNHKSEECVVKDNSPAEEVDLKEMRKRSQLWEDVPYPEMEVIEQKASMLKLHLNEATKTISVEREEKSNLHRAFVKLQQEYNDLRLRFEELKTAKQEALKELNLVKAEHQDEIESIRLDLEDEASSRSSMDRRLADLRAQLERLQAENAAEWGKRERLETDKLALERENKKLRTQIADFEERLERKTKQCTVGGEVDVKALKHEIHDTNKELSDLKHSHSKLKKVLQDKTTELAHAVRRADQYETEVKKLRARVEELKKELAASEDEIDSATNTIRKLQRSNDELQEHVESLQVQVDHLQSRLRNSNQSLMTLRETDSLLNNEGLSEDDNIEF